jgi:excisionase family DNA binding protein
MKTSKRRPPAVDASTELMTLQQVAEYLSCHPTTIYRLLKNRQIPAFKLGFDWRFRRSNIDQWISDRQMKPKDVDEHEPWPRGRRPKSRR